MKGKQPEITSWKEIWNSLTEQLEFIDGLLKGLKMPYPLFFSLWLTHSPTGPPTLYPEFEKDHNNGKATIVIIIAIIIGQCQVGAHKAIISQKCTQMNVESFDQLSSTCINRASNCCALCARSQIQTLLILSFKKVKCQRKECCFFYSLITTVGLTFNISMIKGV